MAHARNLRCWRSLSCPASLLISPVRQKARPIVISLRHRSNRSVHRNAASTLFRTTWGSAASTTSRVWADPPPASRLEWLGPGTLAPCPPTHHHPSTAPRVGRRRHSHGPDPRPAGHDHASTPRRHADGGTRSRGGSSEVGNQRTSGPNFGEAGETGPASRSGNPVSGLIGGWPAGPLGHLERPHVRPASATGDHETGSGPPKSGPGGPQGLTSAEARLLCIHRWVSRLRQEVSEAAASVVSRKYLDIEVVIWYRFPHPPERGRDPCPGDVR